ncbi:MAG: flagellar hook assembly protein FlgD [Pseudomonadales bacterium]|nr:flagellar hook assembly protein FlgD [Pseudomonadales bacterium]
MNEISQVANPFVEQLKKIPDQAPQELDKNAFLKLMVTQLNNQDPLSPQENGEFIAQLAQFSSVEGIENLNSTVEVMSNSLQSSQALQASALVGRSVQVNTDSSYLSADENITGNIKLESSSSSLVVNITNASGERVEQVDLGSQARGDIRFSWDGIDKEGKRHEPGLYKFEAEASVAGVAEQIEMSLSANVNSVTINPDRSVVLNLAHLGAVPLLEVEEII